MGVVMLWFKLCCCGYTSKKSANGKEYVCDAYGNINDEPLSTFGNCFETITKGKWLYWLQKNYK